MNNKQVDILLAVYNPNEEYLIKQLISLNNQTYPNLKLYIFDDCIKKRCNLDLFEKYITNFSYEVLPYCEENLNYMGLLKNWCKDQMVNILLFVIKMIYGWMIKLKSVSHI